MNGINLWHDEEAAQFGVVAFAVLTRLARSLCETDREIGDEVKREPGTDQRGDRSNGDEEAHARAPGERAVDPKPLINRAYLLTVSNFPPTLPAMGTGGENALCASGIVSLWSTKSASLNKCIFAHSG